MALCLEGEEKVNVTDVRVNVELNRDAQGFKGSTGSQRLIAFASIEFDNQFIVSNIRVVKSEEGKVIVSMPSRLQFSGTYRDVAYPTKQELRNKINSSVISKVEMELGKLGKSIDTSGEKK